MKTTIGDQEVYLAPDELPEFEYSLIEVVDPSKVRGSRSTTFDVPGSIEAFQVLGGRALNEEVAAEQPFRIGEGSQILFDGVCTPVEWSDSKVTVAAFGDNAEWINAAKNTKCNELDLGITDVIDVNHMLVVWGTEEEDGPFSFRKYCFPLMDYGSLGSATASTNLGVSDFRFGVQLSWMLKRFFDINGFTMKVTGSLTKIWDKLMIPGLANAYRVANARAVVEAPADNSFFNFTATLLPYQYGIAGLNTLIEADVAFDSPATPLDNTLNSGGSYVSTTSQVTVQVSIKGVITVQRQDGDENLGQQLQFILYNATDSAPGNAVEVAQTTVQVPVGVGSFDVVLDQQLFSVELNPSKQYTLFCQPVPNDVGTIFVPEPDGKPICTIRAGTRVIYEVPSTGDVILPNFQYDIASAFPTTLSVGDVISGLSNILRLAIQTNQLTNTVTFSTLDDYLKPINTGIDWSDRIDESREVVKVQPEVPVRYRFNYTADDKDELCRDYNGESQWTAEGIYNSDGRDDEKEITVKFAATQQGMRFGNVTVPVLKEEDKVTPYIKCKPRILVYEGSRLTDAQVFTFNTAGYFRFPRAYFAGDGGTDVNLGFGDDNGRPGTVVRYWRNYLTRSVKPYLKAQVVVYDDEFMDFAFGRPRLVHDGIMRSWVYVQKIKGKRFGDNEPVECELIPL